MSGRVGGEDGQPSPLSRLYCMSIAAVTQNDDGDGACYVGGGAGHAKKPHWMIVPGHYWPSKNEPTALAGWLHAQRPEEPVL